MNTFLYILLAILLILQIILMVYLLFTNIERRKEDKKFWNKIHKGLDKIEDSGKNEYDK